MNGSVKGLHVVKKRKTAQAWANYSPYSGLFCTPELIGVLHAFPAICSMNPVQKQGKKWDQNNSNKHIAL